MTSKTIKWLVLGIPAVVLALCAAGGFVLTQRAKSDRDQAVAGLAEVGLPKHYDDVKHLPNPEKDAGALIKKFDAARKKAYATPLGKAYFDDKTGSVEIRRKFIAANPELVRLQRQLFAKTELATLIEPSLGPGLLLPQFAVCKSATKLASAHAQVLSADGKPVEALEELIKAAQFARVINTDPSAIAEVVAIACRTMISRRAAEILAANSARADVRQTIRRLLTSSISNIDLRKAISAEVALGLASEELIVKGKFSLDQISSLSSGEGPTHEDKTMNGMMQFPGVREALFAKLYRGYRELYERIPEDPNAHRARIDAAAKWDSYIANLDSPDSAFLSVFMLVYQQAFEAEAKTKAEWRTLKALVEAAEIKARTGKYPATLPVKGADALDPFTEQPLRYQLANGKLTIYSLGADETDNGGALFPPPRKVSEDEPKPQTDTGFSIPYDIPARLR